jgi:hypothetical protein
MALTAEQIDKLATLITEVPEHRLAWVVTGQDIVGNYEEIEKAATGPVGEHGRLVAKRILEIYDQSGLTHRLMAALCDEMRWSPKFLKEATPFAIPPNASEDKRQAFLRTRDHFFRSPELLRYLQEYEPRVCCIVGEFPMHADVVQTSGTGFLVGPDLILTAMHTFDGLRNSGRADEVPDYFATFFDHQAEPPLRSPSDPRSTLRKVRFNKDWLVVGSDSYPDDGKIADLDANLTQVLQNNLDFALIRLDEGVGMQTISLSGGRPRSWLVLPTSPVLLGKDDRIIISQHPGGEPRMVDFGRFTEKCCSGTRIRYEVETTRGSSGAPCFTRDFHIVGLHNTEYSPPGQNGPKANQAISFDCIVPLIEEDVRASIEQHAAEPGARSPDAPTLLWNVSRDPESPRVILGRTRFLTWINSGSAEEVPERRERAYAANAPARGSGKTFSIEVLRAARAQHSAQERIVVLGDERELLPDRVEDLVRVLGDRFSIPPAELEGMPKRPSAALPVDAADGDKLQRWASMVVPRWFAIALERSRTVTVDKRQLARDLVAGDAAFGRETPAEIRAIADSADPVMETLTRWRIAWIALDRLPETSISQEVKDFIAGLIGADSDEGSLPPVLRRIRWLFLGYRPDFLVEDDVLEEALNTAIPDADQISSVLTSAYAAVNKKPEAEEMEKFRRTLLGITDFISRAGKPDTERLFWIQGTLGALIKGFLPQESRV